jgi:hypothetical protein
MSDVLSTAAEIYQVVDRMGFWDQLRDALRRKHKVILFGASGAGKTQFLESFGNTFAKALDQVARTQFAHDRTIQIQDQLFRFTDTPGTVAQSAHRVQALREAIGAGLCGVVNLVCYGYHEYGAPLEEIVDGDVVSWDYLRRHRDLELEQISEWAPLLDSEWIITVVTKADLWWDNKEEVMSHYIRGEYDDKLSYLNPRSHRVTLSYSSVNSRFYGRIPCSGHFDDAERVRCRQHLHETLVQSIGAAR